MAWKKVAKDTVALLSAEAGRNAYDRRLSRGTSREGVRSADRQRSRNVVGVYQLGRERGGMASGQKRDRCLGKRAVTVLVRSGERDATICATEQRVAAALYAMMADDGLTISV